jgi:maltooligosyltrehalose trehalohydrolase
MGQEWGEPAPFLYFVDHGDPDLIQAVRQGRRRELAAFAWRGEVPDPQAQVTFEQSRLHHSLRETGRHRVLAELYTELTRLRKRIPPITHLHHGASGVFLAEDDPSFTALRRDDSREVLLVFHLGTFPRTIAVPATPGCWQKAIDSADPRWSGKGSEVPSHVTADRHIRLAMAARSFCVFEKSPAGSC